MGTLVTEDGRYIDFGDPEENIRQKLESIKKSVDSLVLDNKALRSQIKGFNKDVAIKAKDDEIRSIYQRSIAVFLQLNMNVQRLLERSIINLVRTIDISMILKEQVLGRL